MRMEEGSVVPLGSKSHCFILVKRGRGTTAVLVHCQIGQPMMRLAEGEVGEDGQRGQTGPADALAPYMRGQRCIKERVCVVN